MFRMIIKEVVSKSLDISSIISKFKSKHLDSIEYGCIRDNCGVVAADFRDFARQHGFNVARVNGYFLVDKPLYVKKDFTPEELKQMKKAGYDPSIKKDRIQFAKENNIVDELKKIPHYWNEYNGNIIDFAAKSQFIDTGMSSDMNKSRYIKS